MWHYASSTESPQTLRVIVPNKVTWNLRTPAADLVIPTTERWRRRWRRRRRWWWWRWWTCEQFSPISDRPTQFSPISDRPTQFETANWETNCCWRVLRFSRRCGWHCVRPGCVAVSLAKLVPDVSRTSYALEHEGTILLQKVVNRLTNDATSCSRRTESSNGK
jgi:hypothetical protein